MSKGLTPISVKELKALPIAKTWLVNHYLDNLPSKDLVNGEISAEGRNDSLLIKGSLKTKISLNCDRCFKEFEKELKVDIEELIGLRGAQDNDIDANFLDIKSDYFADYIDHLGNFDPKEWAFEQLSLHIPISKICDPKCIIPQDLTHNKQPAKEDPKLINKKASRKDPRWSELKKLLKP